MRQQKCNPDELDLATLWRACMLSYLERGRAWCYTHRETAARDVEPSRNVTQLRKLGARPDMRQQDQCITTAARLLRTYIYITGMPFEDPVPPDSYLIHRQHQQDALRHDWDGLVAGNDGSVDVQTVRLGAGYVLGADPNPIIMTFCARVGCPLASARAEAANLLHLLRDVLQRNDHPLYTC